jgi:hypothetical protein
MNRNFRALHITGIVLLACLPLCHGQKQAGVDGDYKVLGTRLVAKEVVKGKPYSADGITEITQTLSDGNRLSRRLTSHWYRSGDGRLRLEQDTAVLGIWAASGGETHTITVLDPSSSTGFTLDPDHMRVEHYAVKNGSSPPGPAGVKTESLGTRVMEGLTAQGTRSTLVIPAGQIGNTLPIEVVDESWYSPDLQVVLMTRHHDPRTGEIVYHLTHIVRSEPPASLFEIPPGYSTEGTIPQKKSK